MVNLSSSALTPAQLQVLEKGLSFGLTARPNFFEIDLEMYRFFRTLKLKVQFSDSSLQSKTETIGTYMGDSLGLKQPSHYIPDCDNAFVEAFMNNVSRDVKELEDKYKKGECKNVHHNLSKSQYLALQELANNKDIIIKSADKGGGRW